MKYATFSTYIVYKEKVKFRPIQQKNPHHNKGKVVPLQVRCGPEGGYRYSSTLPWQRH